MPALFLFILRLYRSLRSGLKEPEFRGLFWSVIIILLVGTFFYHQVEGWSWLDSFYFTIITLTTVGYGDFSPQTAVGKIFTVAYVILGLGILSSFIILLAEHQRREPSGLLSRLRAKEKRPLSDTNVVGEGGEAPESTDSEK